MPRQRNSPHRRKPHRNPEEIAQILAAYEASGMTQTAFVAERGLALSTFQLWRRRQRESPSASVADPMAPSFIEVVADPLAPDEQDGFELRLPNGVQLHIPPRFHEQSLKTLLEILHSSASPCSR